MRELKFQGENYTKLAVAGTEENIIKRLEEYLYGTKVYLVDTQFLRCSDNKALNFYCIKKNKRFYLVSK